ncbi:MAG: ABC transporter permease, partial [Candidatus Puniceispirillaceae bacterium]
HITVAIGLMFLLQPSGWLVRAVSPVLTGWDRPPNLNIVPDEYGLMLIVGLIAKELPFFVLMGLSALSQIDVRGYLASSAALGYGRLAGWFLVIQPLIARRLRLSVLIVLVFSLSVVDMAIILAPNTPPPLSVMIFHWFQDPDLMKRFVGSAAAICQLGLIILCCAGWFALSYMIGKLVIWIVGKGWRLGSPRQFCRFLMAGLLVICLLPVCLAIAGMASSLLWAFADVWRFPDLLPQKWGLGGWQVNSGLFATLVMNSLMLGLLASGLSMVMAICWLELGSGHSPHSTAPNSVPAAGEFMIYLPLLVPQTAFLFGLQILLIILKVDGVFISILWAHCLFVFPYIMLSLSEQWRQFDIRYDECAMVLGTDRWGRFWRVKLPILGVPILISFAIGFAVSAALYLPTIFAGLGRFQTLTTEAVLLASAAGRQTLGAAAFMQMLLPLTIFIVAEGLARVRYRRFSAFRL